MKYAFRQKAVMGMAVSFLTLFSVAATRAQDASAAPQPSVEEVRYQEAKRRLEREKEIAELEAEIAKARKDALDATPKAKVTPNPGDLSVSGEDVGYDIIVYRELGRATTRVANSLRQTVPRSSTIAIFDSASFADWTFYRRSLPIFRIVIQDLTADYCVVASRSEADVKMLDSTGGFAANLAGTANLVGQFADILSYFRTQTKLTGKAINIPEDAVVSSLFAEFNGNPDYTLLYPKTFPLDSPVYCGERVGSGSCCGSGECKQTRQVYCSEIANLLDELYRARRAAFAAKNAGPELKKLETYFAEFLKLLSEATPASTETALNKYLSAEQLERLHKQPNTYFLEIKPIRAVGTQRVRKNLFFLTDKLDYAGGVVLSWTLFDAAGKVRNSGIETSYDGFVAPKDLRKRL